MAKKGDTLVEVTLAVGIFSMIAIAVVSLMNSGTSNAQLALETTLAREEIDAQADALRFVHNAYASNKEGETQPLTVLWKEIIANAIDLSKLDNTEKKKITEYAPANCGSAAFPSSTISKGKGKAFVLNTRDLNAGKAAYREINSFNQPSTYPRLVYKGDSSALAGDASSTNLSQPEGIYVIAVKDPNSTKVVDVDGTQSANKSAYYDFYIRTCWYGSGDTTPSTISTEIRLHDTGSSQSSLGSITATFHKDDGEVLTTKKGGTITSPSLSRPGYDFIGWCTVKPTSTNAYGDTICNGSVLNGSLQNPDKDKPLTYDLHPVWEHFRYTINYNSNGSSETFDRKICFEDTDNGQCPISYGLTRSGYVFEGWCDGTVSGVSCSGKTYREGTNTSIAIPSGFPTSRSINLTAIWRERNETITIKLTWTASTDYDSYIIGTKSNGTQFTAYYSDKAPTETVSGVTRVLAQLDHDCTGSCKDETFTINTLGGRNFYYYVRNYRSDSSITSATVTVSGPYIGNYTFNASAATGSGRVWNVFAYKDGKIVTRQKRTSSSSTSGTDGAEINY